MELANAATRTGCFAGPSIVEHILHHFGDLWRRQVPCAAHLLAPGHCCGVAFRLPVLMDSSKGVWAGIKAVSGDTGTKPTLPLQMLYRLRHCDGRSVRGRAALPDNAGARWQAPHIPVRWG